MSTLREFFAELRELGPGAIMLVLAAVIVVGVLTMLGQVYHEIGDNLQVHVAAGVALIFASALFMFGLRTVLRSVESNLLDIGMIGRRFLTGEEVLNRIQEAKSITILKTWFPEKPEIAEALKTALINGASVELILCDPDSEILKCRCAGAWVKHADARRWIIEGLNIVREHSTDSKALKNVWFHDEWPGCPVITVGQKKKKKIQKN